MAEKPVKIDPTMPWCHRFYVPMAYAEQTPAIAGLGPRIEPKGNIIFMKCLGDQCAIWDKELKQCSELSRNLAIKDLSKTVKDKHDLGSYVGEAS